MKRWKSWEFGKRARTLPVARDATAWVAEHTGKDGVEVTPREPATTARRFPSGTPPESLEGLIADPAAYLVKKRRDWDIHKFARLYTGETYPIGATYEIVLRDCWLHVPSGMVITASKEILAFSSYGLNCFYEGHSDCDWDEAPIVEGSHFKMATVWGRNFAHWLMDAVPKADAIKQDDSRIVVLDHNAPAFQHSTLDLLGHKPRMVPEPGLLRFRELHFVTTTRSGVPDPRPLLRVIDRLKRAAGEPGHLSRVYISRQKTRRRIINGEEAGSILRDFGFEEVVSEELDFPAQVRLFSGAGAIFGAHGAGTMNVLFAKGGGALIEALNPRVWDHAAHRVASLLGIGHFHFFAENASKEFDIRIDPRTLERTLALALESGLPPRPAMVEEIY